MKLLEMASSEPPEGASQVSVTRIFWTPGLKKAGKAGTPLVDTRVKDGAGVKVPNES